MYIFTRTLISGLYIKVVQDHFKIEFELQAEGGDA